MLRVMHTMVMADNDKPIQVNQLPAKAQTFLNTYFKDHKVALAKQETELFYKSYDVVFTLPAFNFCPFSRLIEFYFFSISEDPAQIIPEAIRTYVKTNYPDAKILQIERDKKEYEVKLSNRWEIKFDSKMRVIDIDN